MRSKPFQRGSTRRQPRSRRSDRRALLAGIGPSSALHRAGLPVRIDAPTVGSACSDHPQIILEWLPPRAREAPPGEWTAGALHVDSIELLQTAKPIAGLGGINAGDQPLALLVTDLTPRSTGAIALDPANPHRPPTLDYGYLDGESARRPLRDGVRLGLDLVRRMGGTVVSMPTGCDDREVDAWVTANLSTAFHTSGTVPIGGSVDGAGRVQGLTGLRVADTSVLPDAPTRGPALAAVLLGELLA